MLLDKYVLTKAFENLLSYHNKSSSTPHAAPAGYIKRVNQTMNRIDPLLKTLQVRPSPPEGLVQAYLIHIADRSDTNFRKILDLKGVRKADQGHLVELFGIHREGNLSDKLVQQSPLLTPLMATTGLGSSGLGAINASTALTSASSAMPGLPSKFDATSLGEKLLSAARDLGQGTGPGGIAGTEKATMNENLKNFGKFFRRDIGGFGARFGKRDESADGQR